MATRRLVEFGLPLMVCKSVILEREWVMRGHCEFQPTQVASVTWHLLEQGHITVEDRESVEQALFSGKARIDFSDGQHHASYRSCASGTSLDGRNFARRTKKLGSAPAVFVPTSTIMIM